MKTNDIVMVVRMADENTIAVGELSTDGTIVKHYCVYRNQVDTEQKVLAWVYHFCSKRGIDICAIQSFIECCAKMHSCLNVHNKD